MTVVEDDEDLNIKHVEEDMINIQTPASQTEQLLLAKMTALTQSQKQRLIGDLKAISIKSWF